MDEELIIDELFVRKHQKDILEVIPKTLSELELNSPDNWESLNSEQYAIYSLEAQIKLLLGLISSVPQVLCDKTLLKTPIQKVAYLQDMYDSEAQSFVEGGIDLLPTVSNNLSVNTISQYLSTGLITAHYFPGYGAKLEKCIKDQCGKLQFDGVLSNKGNELFLSTKSKYLYAERLCFFMWANWNSDKEWETFTVEEFKEEILYQWQLFNDVSWFHLLMNANEEDFDGLTNEVITEYAQIKVPKVCATLSAMIKAYIKMMKLFREEDKYIVETDDREHFSGFCLPTEQTKEERRIEVAADYLIKNHYIAEDAKNLFIGIMNDRCPSGKIKFLNGGMNGEKDKGGKGVLYAIIRFIREENFDPNAKIEAKRQSIPDYSDDCEHFTFDKDADDEKGEEKWKKIKDCGRKSKSLREIIEHLNSIL